MLKYISPSRRSSHVKIVWEAAWTRNKSWAEQLGQRAGKSGGSTCGGGQGQCCRANGPYNGIQTLFWEKGSHRRILSRKVVRSDLHVNISSCFSGCHWRILEKNTGIRIILLSRSWLERAAGKNSRWEGKSELYVYRSSLIGMPIWNVLKYSNSWSFLSPWITYSISKWRIWLCKIAACSWYSPFIKITHVGNCTIYHCPKAGSSLPSKLKILLQGSEN